MSEPSAEYRRKHILNSPKHTVIEQTSAELAAVWYEIGRSQGLKSRWKTPQAYARANFEKFIPKALELLLSMLNRPDIAQSMKDEIYNAIMERHNDKALNDLNPNANIVPDIDISQLLPKGNSRIENIITNVAKSTANPFVRKKGY